MKTHTIYFKFIAIIISIVWIGIIYLLCGSTIEEESEAARFDRLARDAFKEVYPSLAEQILNDYNIRNGVCLDIGCGPGYLAIEIAKRSNLKIVGVDIDPDAVQIARKNIKREELMNQMIVEQGDVHHLHFADDTYDLIISRGSFLFWENTFQAFREIYRVLKPGGVAFILPQNKKKQLN
jgi:ubiquinone/menaquinone biosynthesis C-methylase UbiE